jgi:hypothetical protein
MKKKICYLILAHSDPTHLLKLVNSLDYEAVFYIHIDKKFDIKPFQALLQKENVFWIKERKAVFWADISQVDATISLVEEALKNRNEYIKMVLLSGACFPIKPSCFIYNFFAMDQSKEHIKYIDMRESYSHYMQQLKFKWFKRPFFKSRFNIIIFFDKVIRGLLNKFKFKNKWNDNIIPFFGSQWWALTPECCEYICNYVRKNPWYYQMNMKSFAPDEHFFHTIIGNSEFNHKADGIKSYTGRGTSKLANLHLIHFSLSKWYSLEDFDDIEKSDKLFVRKLNTKYSSELVKAILKMNI